MGERVGDDGLNKDGLTIRLLFRGNYGTKKRIWGRIPLSWTLGQLKRFSLDLVRRLPPTAVAWPAWPRPLELVFG